MQARFQKKFKIKSHDQVLVMAGKYKGMTGEVQKVDRDSGRVFVSGVNLVTRHQKRQEPKQKLASIHISNVSHYFEKNGKKIPSKVKYVTENGEKHRVLVKTGETISEYDYKGLSPKKEMKQREEKVVVKKAIEKIEKKIEKIKEKVEKKEEKKEEKKVEKKTETKAKTTKPKSEKKTEKAPVKAVKKDKVVKKDSDKKSTTKSSVKKTTKKGGAKGE